MRHCSATSRREQSPATWIACDGGNGRFYLGLVANRRSYECSQSIRRRRELACDSVP